MRPRGTTIVELLVYAALTALVLGAIYAVFFASIRYYRLTQTATELQTSAQLAMARITADLEMTRAATVTVSSNPPAVVCLSPLDGQDTLQVDGMGRPMWQKWICYQLDTTLNELFRYELPLQAPTDFPPANQYTLMDFVQQGRERLLAQNVTGFVISGSSPLQISLTLSVSLYHPQDNVVQILDGVICRN